MVIDVNKPSSSEYTTKLTPPAPPPPCRDHQDNKNQTIPTTTAKDRPNANKNNQDAIPPGIQSNMASMLTGIITANEQERAKERNEYEEREANREAQRKLEYEEREANREAQRKLIDDKRDKDRSYYIKRLEKLEEMNGNTARALLEMMQQKSQRDSQVQ